MKQKSEFTHSILSELIKLPQFQNNHSKTQFLNDLQNQPAKLFTLLDSVNEICAHIALCDNLRLQLPIPASLSNLKAQELDLVKFNRTEHYCIDGFLKEEQSCLILLKPPVLQNGTHFLGLKSIVIPYSQSRVKDGQILAPSHFSMIPLRDLSRNGNYHQNCTSQELDELLNDELSPSTTHSYFEEITSQPSDFSDYPQVQEEDLDLRRNSVNLVQNQPIIQNWTPQKRKSLFKNSSPRRKRYECTQEIRSPEFHRSQPTKHQGLNGFYELESEERPSQKSEEDQDSELRCSSREIEWKNAHRNLYFSNKWLDSMKQASKQSINPGTQHSTPTRSRVLFNRRKQPSNVKVSWFQPSQSHIRSKSLIVEDCFSKPNYRISEHLDTSYGQPNDQKAESQYQNKNEIFSFRHASSSFLPEERDLFSKDPYSDVKIDKSRNSINKSNSQSSLENFLKSQLLKPKYSQSKSRIFTEPQAYEIDRSTKKASLKKRIYQRRSINSPYNQYSAQYRSSKQKREEERDSRPVYLKVGEKGGRHSLTSNLGKYLPTSEWEDEGRR